MKLFVNLFIIFFILFAKTNISFAQKNVEVDKYFDVQILKGSEIYFFIDKQSNLTLKNILSKEIQDKFQALPEGKSPSFGYDAKVSYWFKIKTKNIYVQELKLFFDVSNTNLDYLNFFSKDEKGRWQEKKGGDQYPPSSKEIKHRHFIFPFFIEPNSTSTFYLKVKTEGSVIVPISLITEESLRNAQVKEESLYMFFYGVMTVMALYNFFLFLSLKDFNYLIYYFSTINTFRAFTLYFGKYSMVGKPFRKC